MENGVVCGRGNWYQLCDAATDIPGGFVHFPVVVMTGVKSFSTSGDCSIFLKENCDLFGCGQDDRGQLGQGSISYVSRTTPVLVNTNVKSAWAGDNHVLMELLNGSTFVTGYAWWSTVTGASQVIPKEQALPEGLKPFGTAHRKFWYTDAQGTLYGQSRSSPRPAPVVHNIQAVASFLTTVFLLKNGTAYTSGDNAYGKVGDGSTSRRCGLYWVMDHVQAVAAGYYASYLIAEDGTVYGSGGNHYYQLGNSSYRPQSLSFVKLLTID